MTDVEMKDVSAENKKQEEKKAEETEEVYDPFFELKRVLVLLEKGAKDKDYKMCAALTKKFKRLRKEFSIGDVMLAFEFFLPELHRRVALGHASTKVENVEEKLNVTGDRAKIIMELPETQLFMYNLVLMKLIDAGDFKNAKDFGDFIYARIKDVNLRTMDHLGAKSMYFIGVVYEKLGKLHEVRTIMMEAYKSCCLKLD